MKTNFLTDRAVTDTFWKAGAFLQLSPDRFRVFCGSFSKYDSFISAKTAAQAHGVPVLYYPLFWSFLDDDTARTQPGYLVPKLSFELNRKELLVLAQNEADQVTDTPKKLIVWKDQAQELFKKQFDWIQDRISKQLLMKALPISEATAEGDLSDRKRSIVAKLLEVQSSNYAYGFWSDENGVLGYTPEILSSWNQNTSDLNTMALAGTWSKGSEPPNFESTKIRDEHNFVISDIEKQLAGFKQKHKSETHVVELPHLYHLKTNFVYECKNVDQAVQALHQLHPTAALGVYPRDQKLLTEFSNLDLQTERVHFGSPFGFLSETEAFILVAIRNVFWKHTKIQLFAGCGVTSESQFDEEWDEILFKQASVKKMLGIEN